MTVLQVASSLRDWGGIERYVAYLADGLTRRDHEVMVACPPKTPLDERIAAGKVPITMRGKFNPLSAVPYLRLFRSRRFDVVHVHFSPDFYFPAWAARVTRQPRVVMTRHVALPWSAHKVRMYTSLYDRIIAVSGAVRRKLVESGVPEAKVVVAKAGVPALSSSVAAPISGPIQVGFFGRLTEEKGIDVLGEASRSLPESVQIHVYGRGPLEEKLRAFASDRFVLRGFVENVADAMAAVDVVAVPSVWEEAFPYSVLEAMSIGKAVVASDVGGLPELVEPGRTGFLVPKGNSAAWASALSSLDRTELRRLGEIGREVQRQEYTLDDMAERIEAAYA